MAEQLYKARSAAKAAVTRKRNNLSQLLAEDDVDQDVLTDKVTCLKELFKAFTAAHDAYHETLENEGEIESSDTYFYKEQKEYINALKTAKSTHLKAAGGSVKKEPAEASENIKDDLLTLLNMPKIELQVFSGNPVHYHEFILAFDHNVDNVCNDSDIKLSRLMQYTDGPPKEAIRGCQLIGGDDGYEEARRILKSRFGNAHLVTERIVNDLRNGKHVKSPREIQQLADDMRNALLVLQKLGMLLEVNSQAIILEITSRLPNYLQASWRRKALEVKKTNDSYPVFADLVEYINNVAGDVNDPVYGQGRQKAYDGPGKGQSQKVKQGDGSTSNSGSSARATVHNTQMEPSPSARDEQVHDRQSNHAYARPEPPCVLCNQPHRLWNCEQFRRMTPRQRLTIVNNYKMCHNCLLTSHSTKFCGKRSVCGVRGCGQRHTMYIHIDDNFRNDENQVNSSNTCLDQQNIQMPVVEVMVNRTQKVFALLDPASSTSFCSKRLADNLGIQGKVEEYKLNTLNSSNTIKSEFVALNVASKDGDSLQMSKVYVTDQIPVCSTHVDVSSFTHLKGLEFSANIPGVNVRVDLLIGQDNTEGLIPLEVRKGAKGEPFAMRTIFGWCINGRVSSCRTGKRVIAHFISTGAVESDVSKLWSIENEGLEELSWSQEDKQVIALWDSECVKTNGHYELPIPWKNSDEPLPNNFFVARSRLTSLVKKLNSKNLSEKYAGEIDKLLEKGYAEKVPVNEIHNVARTWYLPHHQVITDKKPDKLRVVFDCSSAFQGQSLNDRCKQGPDLVNKLLHVLIRFRQHQYAIQADIEAMYNQVRIPAKDRDALRFLWLENGVLTHYRMTSHLFGGVWCASSSTYALRETVTEGYMPPLVKDVIQRSFYVDDCLVSVSSENDVREIIHETPKVLKSGGFNLTKFVVNDQALLSEIPENHRAKEVKEFGPESAGRVLGIGWSIESDSFYFKVTCKFPEQITRRNLLSLVSSMYDPLGLVSPLVLTGKLLFQEATRMNLPWDEILPQQLQVKCQTWFCSLQMIESISVPRCVKPQPFDDGVLELHHFSDASCVAYGCCTYIRCVNKDGMIHTQLVMSKCKVAPIKQCTIPRLELQAAVLSVKVDVLLRNQLNIQLDQSYFWTDSECVLKYIKNDTKRFKVFVGNRVSTIREFSDPSQWHHIKGKDNPADILSRGQTVANLDKVTWFQGPNMLSKYKSDWTSGEPSSLILSDNDCELKGDKTESKTCTSTCMTSCVSDNSPLNVLMNHYSSWYRMKRAVAWWIRLVKLLKGQKETGKLSVSEILYAEIILIKQTQVECYPKELRQLSSGNAINKSSSLRSLAPFMDDSGIIRVGGRLAHLNLGSNHPYVLPYNHPVSKAIILDAHNLAHVGTEWTLSNIRKRFWIIKARVMIKRASRSCMTCKRLYKKPCVQFMADLPPDRLNADVPPFSFVGLDVFGPFYVKVNRSQVKRYGCIFTCLSIRAVHIEKLDSLDTESFLNGLRRFMARRGVPIKIFSDNGTNFVAGNKELQRSLKSLSQNEIQAYAVKQNVEWHFNPPSASHMGGVWERLIRTARRIMSNVLSPNVRLTDEILATTFCEIEAIMNGRPLTKCSDDPIDFGTITPNHLLLLREGPTVPPGKFYASDMYVKRWKHIQHLANCFWSKWKRAYLPELQRRIKWTERSNSLSVGDLVLILDENTPRNLWPLALVKEVLRGRDGLVRTVRIKTRTTELVRPITKVVLLETAINA